jgi:hypothetical protein
MEAFTFVEWRNEVSYRFYWIDQVKGGAMRLRSFSAALHCKRPCLTLLNTKVGRPDVFVVEQLCTRPLKGFLSVFQKIGSVGDGERLVHVLPYDQYCCSLFFYLLYDVEYVLHKDGRKTERRFIEHLQVWL